MSDITTGTSNTNLMNNNRTQIHENVDSHRPEESGVHSSAIGTGIQPTHSRNDVDERTDVEGGAGAGTDPNVDYPEQRHTGKVGLGPNYHTGPTTGDKITGLKEEVKGKLTKKPDLVAHGHERRTGELQAKEREEDMQNDPFSSKEQEERPDIKTI